MAYSNSVLVNAQAKLIGQFQAQEFAKPHDATFMNILQTTNIMFPNYMDLRTTESRTVDAKYRSQNIRAAASTRVHNHTGTVGTSGSLTPSWTIYSDKFTGTLKQADNNIFDATEMLVGEMTSAFNNITRGLETAATAHIFADRSAANVGTQQGTFNGTDDTFEVTQSALESRFMQVITSNMHVNNQAGPYDIYCDTVAFDLFGFQAAQGPANSTNLSFQFGGNTFIHSVELGALGAALAASYAKGYCIVVPKGSFAALPWIPKQNRMGHVDTEGQFTSVINPLLGLSLGMHTYKERVDGSGTGGETQDVKTETEISVDVAFETAPLDNPATTSPAKAFALV